MFDHMGYLNHNQTAIMPKGSSVTLLIKIRDYFHTRQTPMTASKSKKYPDYKDTSAATSYRQGLAVSRYMDVVFVAFPGYWFPAIPAGTTEYWL